MTANAGRRDYDATIRMATLHAGEPIFPVRGQDALSGDTARAWAALAHAKGVHKAVVEQALQQADALDRWAPKKLPDADHLNEAEQKQLVYQFGRRAWNTSLWQVPTVEILLAEERGFNAAMAKVRMGAVA